jgi:hypothetical protein
MPFLPPSVRCKLRRAEWRRGSLYCQSRGRPSRLCLRSWTVNRCAPAASELKLTLEPCRGTGFTRRRHRAALGGDRQVELVVSGLPRFGEPELTRLCNIDLRSSPPPSPPTRPRETQSPPFTISPPACFTAGRRARALPLLPSNDAAPEFQTTYRQ